MGGVGEAMPQATHTNVFWRIRVLLREAPRTAWVAAAIALGLEVWYLAHTVITWGWIAVPSDPGKHVFHLLILPLVLWLEVVFWAGRGPAPADSSGPNAERRLRIGVLTGAWLAFAAGMGLAAYQAIRSFDADRVRDFTYPSDLALFPVPADLAASLESLKRPNLVGDADRTALDPLFENGRVLHPVAAAVEAGVASAPSARDLLARVAAALETWVHDDRIGATEREDRRAKASRAYRFVTQRSLHERTYVEAAGLGAYLGPLLSGIGGGAALVAALMVLFLMAIALGRRLEAVPEKAVRSWRARWRLGIAGAVALLLSSWIPLRYMSSRLLAYGPEMPTIGLAVALLLFTACVLSLGWGLSAAKPWKKALGLAFLPTLEFAGIFAFISVDAVGEWLSTLWWPEITLVAGCITLLGVAVVLVALVALLGRHDQEPAVSAEGGAANEDGDEEG